MANPRDVGSVCLKLLIIILLMMCSVFGIVAIANHHWNSSSLNYVGPFGFRVCNGVDLANSGGSVPTGQSTVGCTTCRLQACNIEDCELIDSSITTSSFNCNALRATQAFSVMAVILFVLGFLLSLLLFFDQFLWVTWSLAVVTFWAGIFGIIAMAVWARSINHQGWHYSYGFGLFTAAWAVCMLLSCLLCCIGAAHRRGARSGARSGTRSGSAGTGTGTGTGTGRGSAGGPATGAGTGTGTGTGYGGNPAGYGGNPAGYGGSRPVVTA